MNNPFKKSKSDEVSKLLAKASELVAELEEEKKKLEVRCTSLEVENKKLEKAYMRLRGANTSLTDKCTNLQKDLNEERLQRALCSQYAQRCDFKIAELNAYIRNHCKEVTTVERNSSM